MYLYGLSNKPAVNMPKGFTVISTFTAEYKYGLISYEKELAKNEIETFELIDLNNKKSKGYVPNTKINFIVLEEYDADYNTGKNIIYFNNEEAGILIATGNMMLENEFEVKNKNVLKNLFLDLKENFNFDEVEAISYKGNTFFYDDEFVVEIVNDELIIKDEYGLAFFLCELGSTVEF